MPLIKPTLTELRNQAINEINALVPNADARLRFSVLGVFAKVWAGLVDGLYSLVNWLSKQLFVNTATGKYLSDRGEVYGINRLPASAAAGCAFVQGTAGATINIGTVIQRNDGVQYQTTAGAIIPASGYINIPCIALDTGDNGNATAGVILNLTSPIAGVTSLVVCDDGIGGGSEQENDEALRARIYERQTNPPGAGTKSDWERWAKQLGASVTRVWAIPTVYGLGTVGVVFAEDNNGVVPLPARVAQMQAYLNTLAPLGSMVHVFAPTLKPINFTIHEVPNADPQVRTNILEELRDFISREAYPNNTIPLSQITEAISSAQGETDHNLILPTAPITFTAAAPTFEIGVLGAVTWV